MHPREISPKDWKKPKNYCQKEAGADPEDNNSLMSDWKEEYGGPGGKWKDEKSLNGRPENKEAVKGKERTTSHWRGRLKNEKPPG